jgi:hypothetical protein
VTAKADSRTDLCSSCGKKWVAWLSYKLTPPIVFVAIGRDDPAGAQRRRFEQWRDTIQSQQALIELICARDHSHKSVEAA